MFAECAYHVYVVCLQLAARCKLLNPEETEVEALPRNCAVR